MVLSSLYLQEENQAGNNHCPLLLRSRSAVGCSRSSLWFPFLENCCSRSNRPLSPLRCPLVRSARAALPLSAAPHSAVPWGCYVEERARIKVIASPLVEQPKNMAERTKRTISPPLPPSPPVVKACTHQLSCCSVLSPAAIYLTVGWQ